MKKLLITILILFTLTGCSRKTNSIKEITLWTLQMGDFSQYINEIIDEYETTHKNIKIKWVDIPFSEGEKRT